jgi:TonB family protein
MHYRRFLLFVFAFLMVFRLASAQDALSVDEQTIIQHVDHGVTPVYPPIAKAAQFEGTVVVQVRVGTGKIESIRVVSGPAILQATVLDSLRHWTFHPFVKNGSPVAVTGTISFEFNAATGLVSLASSPAGNGPKRGEEKIAKRLLSLSGECRKGILARTDYPATTSVCKQAAETAAEFAPDVRFIEKREAFVSAAWAFLDSGDLRTALTYAAKAVDVVKLGHDDDSGQNAAYWVKGMVERSLGDLTAADQDMVSAEEFERKRILWADQVGLEPSDGYRRILREVLRFHSQVLQQLNRPEEAQKKLDEAAKYK